MIIGINGYKNAGKDTVADYLVDEYGFDKISFAAKGKQVICETFGITLEQLDEWKNDSDMKVSLADNTITISGTDCDPPRVEMTFRQFIQKLLNEGMKSAYGELFHVDQLLHTNFQHAGFKYVVNDLRFPFEAMRIIELGGYVVRVIRPGLDTSDTHKSEVPLPDELVHFTIPNDGTIEDLQNNVTTVIELIAEREEKLYNA